MKRFAELYTTLDQTTKTNAKVDALTEYFYNAKEEDVIWAVALLTGRKPKRTIKTGELINWSQEMSGLPSWIFIESYHIVGDLAETITLVLPPPVSGSDYSLSGIMDILKSFDKLNDFEKKNKIEDLWSRMDTPERLVFNKLITGSFRVGVSQQLVVKGLAKRYKLEESIVSHRLMGEWNPEKITLDKLLFQENINDNISRPYPFYLAYQWEGDINELGILKDWQIERKFDGIRGQIIFRNNQLFIWSRGEDLMTEKFPEFGLLKELLPDGTVLDGEILPFKDDVPMPFHVMQTRIGRKNVSKKNLTDAPLAIMCYDVLEFEGKDVRQLPIRDRRKILEHLVNNLRSENENVCKILKISPLYTCNTFEELVELRYQSRDFMCEGLMLKHLDSTYESGRRRGKWWKWKIDPLTVDGVLLYAQRGHGRRANLYTDYTFAVWDNDELVPFAKAYSGLTDKEISEVDNWVKKNTIDKFGPVRSVTPELVFEIAFEGINLSPRHKSGVALRFPRILRWRKDKNITDANTKNDLMEMVNMIA